MNNFINKKSISVFIPVYNEENNIDNIISKLLEVVGSIAEDYEILIINDGSTDNSRNNILRWIGNSNKIKIIDHPANLGYGAALRSGFANASKELIFYTDADMPVYLDDIKKAMPFIDTYDLVIGYRINREDTFRRHLYSKIYNLLLGLFLKVRVKDANFSFKCIRRAAIEKCRLRSKSVFIDGELLAEAVRNKLTVKEIPIIYLPRKHGKSNFNSIASAVFTLKELLSYWLEQTYSKIQSDENRVIR